MAITSSYLVAVTRLGEMLEAVRNAQAPERFTIKFLVDLGFKTTNDRLFIALLKGLKFIDPNGVPQQRYYDYMDEGESKRVLADGIRDAYEDLFRVKKDANTLTREQVRNKFKSLTQGQYSDAVLGNMAKTFTELVKFADFDSSPASSSRDSDESSGDIEEKRDSQSTESAKPEGINQRHDGLVPPLRSQTPGHRIDSLSYRIEVVLPTTRDRAVYDAIFRSLRDHLL